MYVRTRNPAAGTASSSVSGYERFTARYIRTDSPRYGTTDVRTFRTLHRRFEPTYGSSAFCQNAAPVPESAGGAPSGRPWALAETTSAFTTLTSEVLARQRTAEVRSRCLPVEQPTARQCPPAPRLL